MKMKNIILASLLVTGGLLTSCSNINPQADAYGHFESIETLVSAEVQGKLVRFSAAEGTLLQKGAHVGLVDTVTYHLQLEQAKAKVAAVEARKPSVRAQVSAQEEQLDVLQIEQERLHKLFNDQAATEKQVDNIDGQVRVLKKQIAATRSQLLSIEQERRAALSLVEILQNKLDNCQIENPINGTVLATYFEPSELVTPGRPLYKIASLDTLLMKCYISELQLSEVKLGQQVYVGADNPDGSLRTLKGSVTWIAASAEFTPKIIQTREERVNLVYAMKIKVPNDGSLKIGMPGEVHFQQPNMVKNE
jgi:HlyD family secretion protein